jgi:hypothetical protein
MVPHEDLAAIQSDTWEEWNIDLSDFSPVNLAGIKKMSIGVGSRGGGPVGGQGELFFDDILLYTPRCMPLIQKPAASFNDDCVIDYLDLEILIDNWLEQGYDVTPVAVPSPDPYLIAHYTFDGNANDVSGNGNDGVERNGPTYVPGVAGQAISLNGVTQYVAIQNLSYSAPGQTEVTVCGWVRTSSDASALAIASFDRNEYWRLEIGGDADEPGIVGWSVMTSLGQVDLAGRTVVNDGQWHHVAGVFNNGAVHIYVDGNRDAAVTSGETFGTGTGRYGYVGMRSEATEFDRDTTTNVPWRFDGELDDVRIYIRALSQAEIADLAGKTETFTQPFDLQLSPDGAVDTVADNRIDFKDYAVLVDMWLDESQLWPQP